MCSPTSPAEAGLTQAHIVSRCERMELVGCRACFHAAEYTLTREVLPARIFSKQTQTSRCCQPRQLTHSCATAELTRFRLECRLPDHAALPVSGFNSGADRFSALAGYHAREVRSICQPLMLTLRLASNKVCWRRPKWGLCLSAFRLQAVSSRR